MNDLITPSDVLQTYNYPKYVVGKEYDVIDAATKEIEEWIFLKGLVDLSPAKSVKQDAASTSSMPWSARVTAAARNEVVLGIPQISVTVATAPYFFALKKGKGVAFVNTAVAALDYLVSDDGAPGKLRTPDLTATSFDQVRQKIVAIADEPGNSALLDATGATLVAANTAGYTNVIVDL